MLHLVRPAQDPDARLAHDGALHLRHQLHLVGAVGLILQILGLLLHGEADFVRVGGEEVCLGVVQHEVAERALRVVGGALADDAGPPVLQCNGLSVFHIMAPSRIRPYES